MNDKIDVLAVIDEVSRLHDNGSEAFDSLREARAAIAELIEACKARDWAEGLAIQADLENGHGLCPEKAYAASVAATQANLRYYAALARASGDTE